MFQGWWRSCDWLKLFLMALGQIGKVLKMKLVQIRGLLPDPHTATAIVGAMCAAMGLPVEPDDYEIETTVEEAQDEILAILVEAGGTQPRPFVAVYPTYAETMTDVHVDGFLFFQ